MLQGFISYSHKDVALCDELRTRLFGFKLEGRAQFWCDHAIDAGDQWHAAIMQAVENADIAILLLSPDFYASEFIWSRELPRIRQRRQDGRLTVLPIRVRASYDPKVQPYEWLRDEQQVPRDNRAVTSLANRDEAWREVILEIDRTIDKVLQQRDQRISSRGDVDIALADAMFALKGALEVVRQVQANIGGVSREEIEAALGAVGAALEADTTALRDELAATYGRLRRCKFSREENARLFQALADLRDQMMAAFEAAREAGFPGRLEAGMPAPKLVPREEVADGRRDVETRLGELEARVKELEGQRLGTSQAMATDVAIDQVVKQVGRQSHLARELLSEPEIDVVGVGVAIEGAARAVGRFVRRVIHSTSTTLRKIAFDLAKVAGSLVRAAGDVDRANRDNAERLAIDLAAVEIVADTTAASETLANLKAVLETKPPNLDLVTPLGHIPVSQNLPQQWYVLRAGVPEGPHPIEKLLKSMEMGGLEPTDLVWRSGFDSWRTVRESLMTAG